MSKEITSIFAVYHKARVTFAQTAAELAKQSRNIEGISEFRFIKIEAMIIKEPGLLELLRPLLLDIEPSVQQNAAKALGFIAGYNEQLGERVVSSDILPQLVYSLHNDNKQYKRYAALVLKSVAKHTTGLAEKVAESGAIEPLVECLSQFDPSVKEAAASALANIAKHSGELAQLVVDQDAIPLLLLCVREPEAHLKQAALGALSNICKHSPELAQAVIDADGIGSIAPLIDNPKTSKHASLCLSNIAKHSVELAQYVVEGEIFPRIFVLLKDNDPITRRNAASCIREIVKQTPELSGIVVSAGGLPAIVSYISIDAEEDAKLPGIMSLGFISAFDETFAASVIKARAVEPIGNILSTSTSDHIKAASAWALGQIGQHSSDHSRAVTDHNTLQKLMDCYLSSKSSEDLKKKAKHALKSIILKCIYIDALAPLLHEKAPHKILKYIVKQYSKVLPNDVEAKRKFAATRGLAKLQQIVTDDEDLKESIQQVILCYPDEVIKFYSPDWDKEVLAKIDEER